MHLFEGVRGREAAISIGIGILFMLIALVIQEIIQEIPDIILLYEHHFNVSFLINNLGSIEIKNALLYSLYVGLVAGFIQEGFTYIAVDTRPRKMAFFIGIGFSIIDIAVIFIGTAGHIYGYMIFLIILNIISSLLFHPGTATFMKWGRIFGFGRITYLISSILHAALDGGVVYVDIYVITHINRYIVSIEIYWSIVMAISVAIFMIGLFKLNSANDSDEIKKEKPVVY
ncbi:MAG: hypothetical protein ACP5UV_01820 [Thermoplasmata archaeon]